MEGEYLVLSTQLIKLFGHRKEIKRALHSLRGNLFGNNFSELKESGRVDPDSRR